MEEVMREFAQLATDRPTALRGLKANGKKIVPYIGQFVPEERLAAEILKIRIFKPDLAEPLVREVVAVF